MAHCIAQKKPKRFEQHYFSATATQTRTSTFFSYLSRENKGELEYRESATACECLNEAHALRAQRIL